MNMKENQISVSSVSDLEFADSGYKSIHRPGWPTYGEWTVYFLHDGEEKQGKLRASLEDPEEDHEDTITLL